MKWSSFKTWQSFMSFRLTSLLSKGVLPQHIVEEVKLLLLGWQLCKSLSVKSSRSFIYMPSGSAQIGKDTGKVPGSQCREVINSLSLSSSRVYDTYNMALRGS